MSDGTFVTFGSPWSHDHSATAHRARERDMDRQERLEAWMVERMAGLTFHSYDTLRFSATRHFELVRGAELTDEETRLIANAARAVWGGLAQRARCQITLNEHGRVEALTIRSAA